MEVFTGPFTAPVSQVRAASGPALPSVRSALALVGLIALHCVVAAAMTMQIVGAASAASGGQISSWDQLSLMGPRPQWAFFGAWLPWVLTAILAPALLVGGAPRAARMMPLVGVVVTLAVPLVMITTFAAA